MFVAAKSTTNDYYSNNSIHNYLLLYILLNLNRRHLSAMYTHVIQLGNFLLPSKYNLQQQSYVSLILT